MTLSRSTPLRRTAFARPAPGQPPAAPRQVRCKVCREKFAPARPGQLVHVECAQAWAAAVREKEKAKRAAKERKDRREKLDGMLTIAQLINKAQVSFNAFIRERDKGLPCICCGKPMSPDQPGGSVDAGHFRSRGAAPQLRFNENNVFAQRKGCNRPGGTTYGDFKAGVIARIGTAAVEALECDNAPHKWTREELIALDKTYRQKLKDLRKTR